MGAVAFLVWLLILVLVVYVAFWIAGQMGLPQPARMILTAIIGLIALLYLLGRLGIFPGLRL